MKQFYCRLKKYVMPGIMTPLWISGLMIAGSDSELMPWVNILGLCLFVGSSLILGRAFQFEKQEKQPAEKPGTDDPRPRLSWHCPERQAVRYALGVFIKT